MTSHREVCTFEGCGRDRRAFGLCQSHRNQQKAGKPLTPIRGKQPSKVRDGLGRKHCARCDVWKPVDQFHQNQRQADGLETICTACARIKAVIIRFNITESRYADMLAAQGGGCAICGHQPPDNTALAVDHDHTCCPERGRSCGSCVRGLLCNGCNTGIGSMQDDAARLRKAADYLDASRR